MDKIVISPNEIMEIKEAPAPDQPRIEPKLPPAIPWWARISVGLLVLCLPLLCLITIILRVAFRGQTPRIRYAWTAFMTTLLIISGFLTSPIAVVAFSLGRCLPLRGCPGVGWARPADRLRFPACIERPQRCRRLLRTKTAGGGDFADSAIVVRQARSAFEHFWRGHAARSYRPRISVRYSATCDWTWRVGIEGQASRHAFTALGYLGRSGSDCAAYQPRSGPGLDAAAFGPRGLCAAYRRAQGRSDDLRDRPPGRIAIHAQHRDYLENGQQHAADFGPGKPRQQRRAGV